MGAIPGVSYQRAVRALEKFGFRVIREGKHTVMTNGQKLVTIPRHNPLNANTMGGIVRDAGLTEQQFGSYFNPRACARGFEAS